MKGAKKPRRAGTTLNSLVALIVLLLLLPAGCSSVRTGGPVQIVYWTGWSGHELDVQQRLIDQFNQTHPGIHVRLLSQFGANGYQKVRIAFAGGVTPDVMSTVWANELASYAARGVLMPLDDDLRKSKRSVDKEYAPGMARMLRVDGHIYGLAVSNNTDFIAYNKGVFRESGVNPNQAPRTIAQFDADANACTRYERNGDFVRYGYRPANLELWAYVFGGGWYDPASARITANSPQNIAALTWMASYAKKYDLKRMNAFQTTFGNNTTPSGPFYVGKVAMIMTGEWQRAFTNRYSPGMDWGWFALPAPPGGRTNTTTIGGSIFVVPAACKHKEEAWVFLNWISSPAAVKTFCWGIQSLPPLISVCDDPLFKNDPLYRFSIPIANGKSAFGPPPIPIWPIYSADIAEVEESALLGGQDPKQLLDALQVKMQREMSRTTQELNR